MRGAPAGPSRDGAGGDDPAPVDRGLIELRTNSLVERGEGGLHTAQTGGRRCDADASGACDGPFRVADDRHGRSPVQAHAPSGHHQPGEARLGPCSRTAPDASGCSRPSPTGTIPVDATAPMPRRHQSRRQRTTMSAGGRRRPDLGSTSPNAARLIARSKSRTETARAVRTGSGGALSRMRAGPREPVLASRSSYEPLVAVSRAAPGRGGGAALSRRLPMSLSIGGMTAEIGWVSAGGEGGGQATPSALVDQAAMAASATLAVDKVDVNQALLSPHRGVSRCRPSRDGDDLHAVTARNRARPPAECRPGDRSEPPSPARIISRGGAGVQAAVSAQGSALWPALASRPA